MSVDTREKRFSMLNFGSGIHIHATFEADGAVDLDDRQHLLDCYSGIAFSAPVIPPVLGWTEETGGVGVAWTGESSAGGAWSEEPAVGGAWTEETAL